MGDVYEGGIDGEGTGNGERGREGEKRGEKEEGWLAGRMADAQGRGVGRK